MAAPIGLPLDGLPLSEDIKKFVAGISATPEEKTRRSAALQMVQDATNVAFRANKKGGTKVKAMAFGSHENGLDSHLSDLDVVITGLCLPDSTEHNGYTASGRQKVNGHLTSLKNCLFRKGMTTCIHIRGARLPILKCTMRSGAEVDVSIADASGVRAAEYLATEVRNHGALRPLVMVAKMLLRQEGLADGSTGGLSSFALALMAIAHLRASEQEVQQQGLDLGQHLLGFFRRFGRTFDLMADGIAPGRGGIVCKTQVPAMQKILQGAYAANTEKKREDLLSRLCIEDPLTGREIAGGCSKAAEVLQAFANGAVALEWSPQVGSLMDVSGALERSNAPSYAGRRVAQGGRASSGAPGRGGGQGRGRGRDSHNTYSAGSSTGKSAGVNKRKNSHNLEASRAAKYRGAPAMSPNPPHAHAPYGP